MDIESFVSQALQQLGAGIEKARGASRGGVTISPIVDMRDGKLAADQLVTTFGGIISFVEFDLSVAVTSRVEGGAEAKAQLQVIGLDLAGAKLEGGVDHTRVQRIKFQVPVSFPAQS